MTRPFSPFRLLCVAVLTAAFLGGTACSSDGSEDGGSSTTASTGEATTTTTTTTSAPASEQEYIDGFIVGVTKSGLVTPEQGQCIATTWTELIGADALVDAGVTPEQYGTIDPEAFGRLALSGADADALFDRLEPCGFDIVELLRKPANPDVTAAQQTCVDDVLTPEAVREAFTAGLAGPSGAPKLGALQSEAQTCLGA